MQTQEAVFAQVNEEKGGSTVSGILLVAGTCIGAGMLAMPIVTGVAGFYPAIAISTICWLFMLCTGLLFLEATLWMEDGANVMTMAQRFLGPVGRLVGGISFLFLYYCLEVSYIAGGTPLLSSIIAQYSGTTLEGYTGYLTFAALFGVIVYLGTKALDRINWILMFGLVFSYILLISVGSTAVNSGLLIRHDWSLFLLAAPTLFSAYGYHNVVPSIATYMKRNVNKLRLAIVMGTAIPFIVFSIWQWMIIGSLSEIELKAAETSGIPISQALQTITGHPWVAMISAYFGFFALVTSFLGVSLSMIDFLADGLKVKSHGKNRLFLSLAVFLPPALIAAHNPGIFLEALGVAGGFGEAVLNGLFPIAMVWIGRYYMGLQSEWQLPGGRLTLSALLLFTLLIIGLEAFHLLF